jgi:hypothetical protein
MKKQVFLDCIILLLLFVLICALGCSCKGESEEVAQLKETETVVVNSEGKSGKLNVVLNEPSVPIVTQPVVRQSSVDIKKWQALLDSLKGTLAELQVPGDESVQKSSE